MEPWENNVARYLAEAQAILADHDYPTAWAELQTKQPTTRLVGLAIRVVAAADYLEKEVERNRTRQALSRFHNLVVAYEEMDILANHPELIETAVTTRRFHKNLRTGIRINQGGDKGRGAQGSDVTEQELKDAIDAEAKRNPRHKIGAIRQTVSEHFGISTRWVSKKTGSYNPLKK